jgi:hypothetical protein
MNIKIKTILIVNIISHGYETLSLTFREEQALENTVLSEYKEK